MPRFWGTWAAFGLLWVVMFLPRKWVMALGGWLGDRFRKKNKKRRRIVEVNLELCFPDKTAEEREAMCVEHFRVYCRCLLDSGLALFSSESRVRKLIAFEGLDEYRQVLKGNKVIAIGWHLTTMEFGNNILGLAGPAVSMMKPMKNPLLTWIFAYGRTRTTDTELVTRDRGMRPLLKGLKEGRQCVLFPDEDLAEGGPGSTFVPFFGVERSMVTTPGRLARSSRAKVVTCATQLDSETGRYYFRFGDSLPEAAYDTPESMALAISQSMETLLREMPEHYMWTFRWFKTRPGGAPSPYDPVPQK